MPDSTLITTPIPEYLSPGYISVAITIGLVVFFVGKFIDNVLPRINEKRRIKRDIKNAYDLVFINSLKDDEKRAKAISEANHYLIKAIFYILLTMYFNNILKSINKLNETLDNILDFLNYGLYLFFLIMAIVTVSNAFIELIYLRKYRKREKAPSSERGISFYDTENFGMTLEEAIEIKAKDQEKNESK